MTGKDCPRIETDGPSVDEIRRSACGIALSADVEIYPMGRNLFEDSSAQKRARALSNCSNPDPCASTNRSRSRKTSRKRLIGKPLQWRRAPPPPPFPFIFPFPHSFCPLLSSYSLLPPYPNTLSYALLHVKRTGKQSTLDRKKCNTEWQPLTSPYTLHSAPQQVGEVPAR